VAVTPDGKTGFVTNANFGPVDVGGLGDSVSTIDVETRTKHPGDITVGRQPLKVAVTPDGTSSARPLS
jgi:DNA-binding beta-propeller fold protein YncE